MAVEILKPEKKQSGGMFRRLAGIAAPLAGAAIGGTGGAAIGGMIGSKINGGSSADAIAAGAESAMSRRLSAKTDDPSKTISDGLSVLGSLPQDNPLRDKYAGTLIQADMLGRKKF